MSDNYYSVLGCTNQSSVDDIKKAYKKLALLHHPDKNNGNDEMFKKISEAYSVLSDPEKKTNYDRFGSADGPSFERQGGPHPFSFGGFENFFGGGFPFGGAHSFSFQHQHQPQNVVKKCSDIQTKVEISLQDVFTGFSTFHTFNQKVGCSCVSICKKCAGKGKINIVRDLGIIKQSFQIDCPDCSSTGIKQNPSCKDCGGSGYKLVEKKIRVNGPRGLNTGSTLTLPKGGEQPSLNIPNMQPGDLLITLSVREHPTLIREDNNLVFKAEISWIDSICGTKIDIPLFDEVLQLNTHSFGVVYPDKKYSISNKGLFDVNGNRGDLYLYFTIKQPNLSEDSCKKVREYLSSLLLDEKEA